MTHTTNPALSGEEIDKLEALARAATPGPWEWASDWDRAAVYSTTHKVPQVSGGHIFKRVVCSGNQNNSGRWTAEHWSGSDWSDAKFIAAANPATIITLIAQARAARQAPRVDAGVQADDLAAMEARKDAAYLERNQVVAALAKCFPSGVAKTAIEGWSEDWHGCVYIDLPTGQVSWHFHDSQSYLFDGLTPYAGKWDGHDTPEKYRRVAALAQAAPAVAAEEIGLMPALVINRKLGEYIAANKPALLLLNDEERSALLRFKETCEDSDSGGYDVSKEMMKRLAAIGVIESKGFGRYQFTAFGDFVADRATVVAPTVPAERNAVLEEAGDAIMSMPFSNDDEIVNYAACRRVVLALKDAAPTVTAATLREDHQADRHYLLGLRAGWNMGVAGDNARFDAACAVRERQLREARAELAAPAAQAQPAGAPTDDARSNFEVAHSHMNLIRQPKGAPVDYVSGYTQIAWERWQAAQPAGAVAPSMEGISRFMPSENPEGLFTMRRKADGDYVKLADVVQLLARQAAAPAQAEPVAWMNPDTLDVIHDNRKHAWENDFGLGGKSKAAGYTQPLYATAPAPAQAGVAQADDATKWRELLVAVMRELPSRSSALDQPENAPGHGHSVPGVWDRDNGAKAGKECAWCKVWNEARAAIQASANNTGSER